MDQSDEKRRTFNLKEYIEEILLSLHPKLRRTGHTINFECPDDLVLNSFPGSFYQIISNMVLNSLLHGFEDIEKGQIEIKIKRSAEHAILEYTDDGKGMNEEVVKQIFDPFYTTRRGSGGSGLGMHIVYNLVTQGLQGVISCESEVGKGVRFKIQVPLDFDPGRTGPMWVI